MEDLDEEDLKTSSFPEVGRCCLWTSVTFHPLGVASEKEGLTGGPPPPPPSLDFPPCSPLVVTSHGELLLAWVVGGLGDGGVNDSLTLKPHEVVRRNSVLLGTDGSRWRLGFTRATGFAPAEAEDWGNGETMATFCCLEEEAADIGWMPTAEVGEERLPPTAAVAMKYLFLGGTGVLGSNELESPVPELASFTVLPSFFSTVTTLQPLSLRSSSALASFLVDSGAAVVGSCWIPLLLSTVPL